MAKRGNQEDEQADTTIVVDVENYSIPDGTRCVSGITAWPYDVFCLL